jgi:hypothetical protein
MNNSHVGYTNILRAAEQYPTENEAKERALNMLRTMVANLDNQKLSDHEFREFCRNSLSGFPGLEYQRPISTKPID